MRYKVALVAALFYGQRMTANGYKQT